MERKPRLELPARKQKDIIDHLESMMPDLHPAETSVARLVLEDPDWVVNSSIKELAERADVSEPSVMRVCRKLGMDGFVAFKMRLAQDLVVAKLYMGAASVIESETPSSIAQHMREAVLRCLDEAARSIDPATLGEAARLIGRARRIFCFGVGGSSAIIAEEAENRLFRLGLSVQATADPYRQRMSAAIAGTGDFFLCISATGKPRSVVESAKLARANGSVICSIAPSESPLALASDILLRLDVSDSELFFNLPSAARYAQMFILDCFSAAVAKQVGKVSVENLKAIRAVLSAHHGPNRNQPVGD